MADSIALLDRAPEDAIVRLENRLIPVSTFLGQVRALQSRLPKASCIINLCTDRYHFLLGFAATIAAGRTNLLPPNRLPATITALRSAYPDSELLEDPLPAACLDAAADRDPPCIASDHLAAVVFTSGSTGQPQAIPKPWRTFVDSTRLNARELGVADTPAELLATVPGQHMYGLETSILLPLFAPVTTHRARPLFPADIAAALATMEPPRILVSTPVHLRALLASATTLAPLARIWSATAPLDRTLAGQLEQRYAATLTEIYGCSETGSLARRAPARERKWSTFAGFSLHTDGEDCTATASHLPAAVRLNDRLDLLPDGRFRLLGRDSDLINIAGKRGSLADLNQQLASIPGVLDSVVFEPEADDRPLQRLAALVVAPTLNDTDIRRALSRRVDAAFLPRPILHVAALPRAETGKLCRAAVLELYRALS